MKVLQYAEPVLQHCSEQQRDVVVLRLGMVHQRLASLYHHVLRNQVKCRMETFITKNRQWIFKFLNTNYYKIIL